MIAALPVPKLLATLVRDGVWPNEENANRQNLSPLAPVDAVSRLAPDETGLFLRPPPFPTLADDIAANPDFWLEHGALNEVDPDLALDLGDFGLGSDSAIILDYRTSRTDPTVLRLAWTDHGNHWVPLAANFEEFAQGIGLA